MNRKTARFPSMPGLQMAFIDGNQTERLCEPMKQYIEARGGQVLTNQPLASYLDAVAAVRDRDLS